VGLEVAIIKQILMSVPVTSANTLVQKLQGLELEENAYCHAKGCAVGCTRKREELYKFGQIPKYASVTWQAGVHAVDRSYMLCFCNTYLRIHKSMSG
jgi:hypothetical protein